MNEVDDTAGAIAPSQAVDRPASIVSLDTPPFFAVSATKLVVMSICTFGLYEIWWFYMQWRRARERGADVWPVARAIFPVIFCHALFKRIRDYPESFLSAEDGLPAGPLAAGWIVVSLLWRLPDPFWLVSFCAVAFLVPVQIAANRHNLVSTPQHDPNRRFSIANWVAIVLGGLLLVLGIIGTLMPEVPADPISGVTRL